MCVDSDLFGEVNVTYDDVELFLRSIPRHVDGARFNAVQSYVENYDVVNKIKGMKRNKSFYSLDNNLPSDNERLSNHVSKLLKPHFMPSPIIPHSMYKRRSNLNL